MKLKNADDEILNQLTQKIMTLTAQPTPKMKEIITKLNVPH